MNSPSSPKTPYLSTSQDRVLGRVVRVVLGGNLQHGRGRRSVRIDHVTDHFRVVLVDQDDVDVVTLDEALEAILDLADGSVCREERREYDVI